MTDLLLYDPCQTPITSFTGRFRFLSNFWLVEIEWEGLAYRSVEHAYQATKTDSLKEKIYLQSLETPGEVKRASKGLSIKSGWDAIKYDIMWALLLRKFSGDDDGLQEQLLGTGQSKLIEGNTWGDTYWGVCNRKGENRLGIALMEVRQHLLTKVKNNLGD